MFGEVYKIKEEEIPQLIRKARQKKIRNVLATYIFVAVILTLVYYPLYHGEGISFVFPILLPLLISILIVFIRNRRIQYDKIYKNYELTISEGSISCVNTGVNYGKPISIQFSEISRITHYINDSILIVGTDLSHSFSIPNDIERKNDIIEKLNRIKSIEDGKREKNLYYLQRVNMWLFVVSVFGIIAANNPIINGLSCVVVLYTTFLPIYFFITTRKLSTRIKLINGLFLLIAFIFVLVGISKIIYPQ